MAAPAVLEFHVDTGSRVTDWKGFYEEHFDLVWRLLARFGAPEGDLEDLTQEVFVIAHRKLPDFRWEASPKTWLFTLCRRVAANARRRSHVRRAALLLLGRSDASRDLPRPDVALARRDVERLLSILSETQRMTVLFREVDGMSVPEIAEVFGCPEATVWSRLRLAWKLLKGESDDE